MLGGHYWEIVTSGHNTHELTATAVANTRSIPGQVTQHPCMEQKGVRKPPFPAKERLRVDGFCGLESQFSLAMQFVLS